MAKDRSLVRASYIGAWTFCNRAWWLSVVKDAAHANPDVLTRGTAVTSLMVAQSCVYPACDVLGLHWCSSVY